jgi:hypothetical protein
MRELDASKFKGKVVLADMYKNWLHEIMSLMKDHGTGGVILLSGIIIIE